MSEHIQVERVHLIGVHHTVQCDLRLGEHATHFIEVESVNTHHNVAGCQRDTTKAEYASIVFNLRVEISTRLLQLIIQFED